MLTIIEDCYCFEDTCRVYVLRSGSEAVIIDFGAGDVLDALGDLGIQDVKAVLITHHHRDQVQGLARAAALGIPIWVPHAEQELFDQVESFWQGRGVANNYNVRQDRFSLVESIGVAGTLRDYQFWQQDSFRVQVLPTPGHTPGGVSFTVDWHGQRLCFCGDLLYAPGKLWSLAATQWTYNGSEGVPATILSLLDLNDRGATMLLPSHGPPVDNVPLAVDTTVERLRRLLELRGENPRLLELRQQPYEQVTPHLLRHRCSFANAYVLLSDSGSALFIDAGYDFVTGWVAGTERAAKRPWLYTLPALKRQYGVKKIEVVLPTHYHDDHVAGMNLLRDVEGAQTWVAANFADVLARPLAYNIPCLWYDPIVIDRVLPLEQEFSWQEYRFTLYPLPGHTRYAVAISTEVDGKRVLFTGDQYQRDDGTGFNYVFQNHYRVGDYRRTAELYRSLNPELILTGHWQPLWVQEGYFAERIAQANAIEQTMRDLLPDEICLGDEDFVAHITPYRASGAAGQWFKLRLVLYNPLDQPAAAHVTIGAPAGWQVRPPEPVVVDQSAEVEFAVLPPVGLAVHRARITADVTLGNRHFGQHAEALVTVYAEE